MEDELSKANLIAILTAIKEYAKEHSENDTAKYIEKILEEVKK